MYYYTNILCTYTGVEIAKVWEKSEIKTIFKLLKILFVNSTKYTFFLHPNGLSWGACTSFWRPLLYSLGKSFSLMATGIKTDQFIISVSFTLWI